jgi:RimJ/RimL family protein N-acetyltransferase
MTHLQTQRLVLRKARIADLEDLHAVYRDPLVMRYWSTPPHDDIALTRRNLTAFPLIHEVYPAALKKFQHSSGLKRSQISPIALMR